MQDVNPSTDYAYKKLIFFTIMFGTYLFVFCPLECFLLRNFGLYFLYYLLCRRYLDAVS